MQDANAGVPQVINREDKLKKVVSTTARMLKGELYNSLNKAGLETEAHMCKFLAERLMKAVYDTFDDTQPIDINTA